VVNNLFTNNFRAIYTIGPLVIRFNNIYQNTLGIYMHEHG